MPGKGKPFVSGDPRQKPGSGRPKKEYLEALRTLEPAALAVLEQELEGKHRLSAAQDILNRLHGTPKDSLEVSTDPRQVQEVLIRHVHRDQPA